MISATSARWSGLTSATTADDQIVATAPVASAAQAAIHRPRRPAAARSPSRPQRQRDAHRREQVRPEGHLAQRQPLEQPGDQDVGRVAGGVGDAST